MAIYEMNRFTRVLPGAGIFHAAALASAYGKKPAEIRLKETRLKVYGLARTVSVVGDVVDKKGEIVPGMPISWESSDPKVATALTELQQACAFYKCLGSYPAEH
mgnify:CR=1 FL=1